MFSEELLSYIDQKLNDIEDYYYKEVYDLTALMKKKAEEYLIDDKFLYWRDDTHWNHNGIFVAMTFIKDIMKK